MAGRSLSRWVRVFVDGYNLSGYGRSIGPLAVAFDTADLTAQMSDTVKGYLFGAPSITPGTFNGVMQSTTDSGTEISKIQTAGVSRDILVAIGDRAAPVAGNPAFVCKSTHSGFQVVEDGGAIAVNADFGEWDASDIPNYSSPWGIMLTAEYDSFDETLSGSVINTGLDTSLGGFFMYQVLPGGSGRWVVKVMDDPDGGSGYADVEGLTVTISDASVPQAGIIQTTAITTQIEPYVKLFCTEDAAGTLILAAALVRGR
jgi:hypothetical protein